MLELLLGQQDLGGDWQINGQADLPRERRTSNPGCTRVERDLYDAGSTSLVGSLRWRMRSTEASKAILQVVKVHPKQGAEAEVSRVRASVKRCRSWGEGGDAPGYIFTLSMRSTTAPQAGDEAVAWRYTSRYGPASPAFTTYNVLFRLGDVTSLIEYAPGTRTSAAAAEKELHELAASAAARVDEAI
ncbi:hypothetical protein [Micromonospora coriariae]|uniref:hypothetical protein n=1 Tax=Micromonospora coriariae TaxID=285665 RepID=UPI001560064A|nr:hypothetical protein [Micromonospora coriariae]